MVSAQTLIAGLLPALKHDPGTRTLKERRAGVDVMLRVVHRRARVDLVPLLAAAHLSPALLRLVHDLLATAQLVTHIVSAPFLSFHVRSEE